MTSAPSLPRQMPARLLAGVPRPASTLAIGTSALGSYDRAAPVYDAFFEAGGNFFDTAWVYGQSFDPGCCERVLGRWIRSRGLRDEVVLIAKGGHPPHRRPDLLRGQLLESCDRLGVDRVDLYMPHRDDVTLPASAFAEACAQIVSEDLASAYGFSNWTLRRVGEAMRHVEAEGLPAPVAVSNQLSLLRMERPVYPGCVSARDRASREWLIAHGVALVAWSSQARGLHTGRDAAGRLVSGDHARCWYSPANVARLERTAEFARRRAVEPISIALAWVLHQPFTVFPLIGPRLPSELHGSLPALEIELSPDELTWLDLGEGLS